MTQETQEEEILDEIQDQDEKDDEVAPVQYDISTYGADYPVDGLVKRLQKGDIFIPDFQRDYVWNQAEASRLIESLLLGLPIPGVFLARENEGNKLLIIDGQQRLKSLQFFYEGYFNPKDDRKTKRIFKLLKVQKRFENLTYEKLEENDRIKLDDSIVHATIIKQEAPDDENTSIYHVFERLNNGGKKLTPQEIRTAIYYGGFNDMIHSLNLYKDWREMFGPISVRLKDKELILRFLASFYNAAHYSKPMVEFLNKYNKKNRNPNQQFIEESSELFKNTITFLKESVGKSAFRPEGVLNVSVFEGVTVGLARIIQTKGLPDGQKFKLANQNLLKDTDFLKSVNSGTSDDAVFKERHSLVDKYFSKL
jgi:uncharacterized protein with ParB-like and HNH nuclease domain